MLKKNKGTLLITTLVLLLPMLIGLILWNKLPQQIPSHWNIDGQIDDWSSRASAVFLFPSLLIGIHWICILASCADPKRKNYHPKMFTLVLWICPILSLALNTLVYCAALGYSVRVEIIIPLMVGALFVIIGNLLPKCKQSYTMGIKLPWTLASEENWNKTHRFGGRIWVLGGIVIMCTSIVGNFWVLMGTIIGLVLIPTVYSYLYYAKYEKQKND